MGNGAASANASEGKWGRESGEVVQKGLIMYGVEGAGIVPIRRVGLVGRKGKGEVCRARGRAGSTAAGREVVSMQAAASPESQSWLSGKSAASMAASAMRSIAALESSGEEAESS